MTTKLHIGNIPSTATDKDLEIMFRRFGLVESVGITRDPHTGSSKGCGYVEMRNEVDADTAISRLNFSQYGGRTIGVSRARTTQKSAAVRD
ncbi:MAG: RNA recognition motif domain-containing protein [Woeseia sp.]